MRSPTRTLLSWRGASLRRWCTRSTLAIIDQGFVSGTSMLVNISLARSLPAVVYGAFAIAFTLFLFVAGFHNVLLLEPMSVLGPANYPQHLGSYFAGQVRLHGVLTAALSLGLFACAGAIAAASGRNEITKALLALGAVLPFLLLFWVARRMLYIMQRPRIACFASLGYLLLATAGISVLRRVHHLSAVTAFAVVGIASFLPSLFLLWAAGVRSLRAESSQDIYRIARENWNYGKWMIGASIFYSTAFYGQMFVTASIFGAAAAGVLRAMQLPSMVMAQATTAISLLGLSSLSYDFGQGSLDKLRSKGQSIAVALTATAVIYEAILALTARPLEHLLYGGRFASQARLIPLFGVVPVLLALSTGLSLVLRSHQITKIEFLANALAAPAAIISALVGVRLWGLAGAAFSSVVAGATSVLVTGYFYYSLIAARSPSKFAVSSGTRVS
jgi:O-antigen/teichoic acid export membrane protein